MKPRLTIACESYWPELTSTSQLITELAECLSPYFEVEVLAAQPRFSGSYDRQPAHEERNGVRIHRLPATSFPKTSRFGRLANWLTFLGSLSVAILERPGRRTYLFLTNPPTAPWAVALASTMRQRSHVLVYDLYPDLAVAIGAVAPDGLMAKGFDLVNRFAFRVASGLVALGEDMRSVLREKVADSTPITVIPNWANGDVITPSSKAESRFARAHHLVDRTVFLYAGNLGLFQDLETLVEAVEMLPPGEHEPALVFVGAGGKRAKIEALAAASRRVSVLDFVPYDELGDLYAAADVGMIALEPGVEKTNVPSKTYSILAAGKPFLAVCESSTDLQSLADEGCGVCVKNDPLAVSEVMQRFVEGARAREEMGKRSRHIFESRFSRDAAVQRYRDLFSRQGERKWQLATSSSPELADSSVTTSSLT